MSVDKEVYTGMVSQKVVIKNPTGLHLRPAGILCKEAMQFKSLITFSFRETTANAKSVLSVLGACVKCGDEIEIVCDGEDEADALKALVTAIENGLGE
jgi:phosphocarrier protein